MATKPILDASIAHSTFYTSDEVSVHKTIEDCWSIVNGKVYNLTSFIPAHPGGEAIVAACGVDGTSLFDSVSDHQRENAQATLDMYFIGTIK